MTTEPTLREKQAERVMAWQTGPSALSSVFTLRERVVDAVITYGAVDDGFAGNDAVEAIARILEDTGAPAHMWVAAELRGNASE